MRVRLGKVTNRVDVVAIRQRIVCTLDASCLQPRYTTSSTSNNTLQVPGSSKSVAANNLVSLFEYK